MTQQIIFADKDSGIAAGLVAPGTPAGSWDPDWLIAGKVNNNFNDLYPLLTGGGTLQAPVTIEVPVAEGSGLIIDASANATNVGQGAQIALIGNGTTTKSKYIRAFDGNLQVINDAYAVASMTLSDAGAMTVPVSFTAPSYLAPGTTMDFGVSSTNTAFSFHGAGSFTCGPAAQFNSTINSGPINVASTAGGITLNGGIPGMGGIGIASGMQGLGAESSLGLVRWNVGANPPVLALAASNSGTVGSFSALASGTQLGRVLFCGDSGSTMVQGASIQAQSQSTFSTTNAQSELVFNVSYSGSVTPSTVFTLNGGGEHQMLQGSPANTTGVLQLQNTVATGYSSLDIHSDDNSLSCGLGIGGASAGSFAHQPYLNSNSSLEISTNGACIVTSPNGTTPLKINSSQTTGAPADMLIQRFTTGNSSTVGGGPCLQLWDNTNASTGANAAILQVGNTGFGIWVNQGSWVHTVNVTNGALTPGADNAYTLGASGLRWSTVYAATGTINTSDRRLKIDAGAAPGTDFVMQLEPRLYQWKDGKRLHAGFYAQDVRRAMGETEWAAWGLDDKDDADSRQWIRPDELVPSLVKTVQELVERVRVLQSTVLELKSAKGV